VIGARQLLLRNGIRSAAPGGTSSPGVKSGAPESAISTIVSAPALSPFLSLSAAFHNPTCASVAAGTCLDFSAAVWASSTRACASPIFPA